MKNEKFDSDWVAGLEEGAVGISKLSDCCSEDAQTIIDEKMKEIISEEIDVFSTETFSVNGKPYTGKGKGHGQEGSTIKIYYNPEDPNMNLTDTHMDIWNGKTAKKTFLYVLITIGAFILLAVLGGLAARFL